MRNEFADDLGSVKQDMSSATANASGGSHLTADEAHDENFRRMLDKYYSEVDDTQQCVGQSETSVASSGDEATVVPVKDKITEMSYYLSKSSSYY